MITKFGSREVVYVRAGTEGGCWPTVEIIEWEPGTPLSTLVLARGGYPYSLYRLERCRVDAHNVPTACLEVLHTHPL